MIVLSPLVKPLIELVGMKSDVIIMVEHSILTSIGLLIGGFDHILCYKFSDTEGM